MGTEIDLPRQNEDFSDFSDCVDPCLGVTKQALGDRSKLFKFQGFEVKTHTFWIRGQGYNLEEGFFKILQVTLVHRAT